MNSLDRGELCINLRAIRDYADEHNTRSWKFTRVSRKFYEEADLYLKAYIIAKINAHPSMGKTL